jgi:hypothetical protein
MPDAQFTTEKIDGPERSSVDVVWGLTAATILELLVQLGAVILSRDCTHVLTLLPAEGCSFLP